MSVFEIKETSTLYNVHFGMPHTRFLHEKHHPNCEPKKNAAICKNQAVRERILQQNAFGYFNGDAYMCFVYSLTESN